MWGALSSMCDTPKIPSQTFECVKNSRLSVCGTRKRALDTLLRVWKALLRVCGRGWELKGQGRKKKDI